MDVVELAGDDHVAVALVGVRLGRRDEPRAHVAEVAAQRPRRPQRPAIGLAAGDDDDPVEHRAHGTHEGERIREAGLAARATGQEHESVDARLDGALGVVHVRDVRPHLDAGVLESGQHVRRRADARDDGRRAVAHDGLDVRREADVGGVHDEVRHIRGDGFPGIPRLIQLSLDPHEPALQLAVAARVGGRERAEDAGAAGGHHELRAGHDQHRGGHDRHAQ
ncbi:hypothetical protein GCM10022287_16020 [Gryllotalpicola koreensis]|uniref:Uncharacterized protein n=1 Tax=Gryllotalpicola koreensis TaxID=993086 RepID=A0ABP7ZYH6_9MICO